MVVEDLEDPVEDLEDPAREDPALAVGPSAEDPAQHRLQTAG